MYWMQSRILKSRNLDVPIIGNITGPVSTASSVMEPVIFYKELRKKREDAHKYMELVADEIIRFARAQIDAGADIIAISDPSGTGEFWDQSYLRNMRSNIII